MRCGVLVGRDAELAALRNAVEAATRGQGAMVAVVGDAGAGKSRLLAELAGAAGTAGLQVLSGRAVPGGSPVPYRPLSEAFLTAFRSSPPPVDRSLAGFRRHLARLVPSWESGPEAGGVDSPVLVAEAVVRLLVVHGATTGGAVLLLEDVHCADPETLAVLDYLIDALRTERVLCVCTARPTGAAVEIVDRLERRPEMVVRVAPLSDVQVDRMVAACLSVPLAPVVLSGFIRAHSDGNPFLVEELLAGVVASGELRFEDGHWSTLGDLTPTVPVSLRGSIQRRLAALDATARRVLGAAALLGRHFEWELLPGIAEVDGRAAVEGFRAAVDEQLIDVDGSGFRFRHALTREAVLADLLPPERRDLAARAWPAVERANPGLPGPTCELAADLAEAAGERTAAAERLLESSRRAVRAGALATAEATAHRARRLADADPAVALDADELLVRVLVAAGKPGEALMLGRDLAGRLEAAGAPILRRADLLVTTAEAAVTAGDVASAAADVAAARAAAGEGADAALDARIDAVAAHVSLDQADVGSATRLAHLARDGAAATGQPAIECDALLVLGRIGRTSNLSGASEWCQRAAQVAEEAGLGSWHLRARHELAMVGLLQGDPQLVWDTRAVAARYGALVTVAVMDLVLAGVALTNYDRVGCLAAASACVEASRRYGLATESVAHLWLAGAHALAGDDAAMQVAIHDALAAGPEDQRILADLYGRVLPTRAFVNDELQTLPGLLDRMIEHVRRAPPTLSVYPGRVLWALLHTVDDDDLGVGPRTEFREAADQYDDRLGLPMFALSRDLIEAVALGRLGDAAAANARFEPAYAKLASTPVSLGSTHAYSLVIARAALRDGWGEPVRWLRAAEAFFAAGGYDRLVRRCRTMLGEAGVPVPRRGRGDSVVPSSLRALGVTSREVDVLKLVAAGRTNKEVAAELFLSTKTVERHLSSIFDRMGVRDRRALAGLAADHLGDGIP